MREKIESMRMSVAVETMDRQIEYLSLYVQFHETNFVFFSLIWIMLNVARVNRQLAE